jgi:hypothetical protein
LSRYYIVEYLHGFFGLVPVPRHQKNSTFFPVAEIVAKSARLESTLNMAAIPLIIHISYAKFIEPNFSLKILMGFIAFTPPSKFSLIQIRISLIPNLSLLDLLQSGV